MLKPQCSLRLEEFASSPEENGRTKCSHLGATFQGLWWELEPTPSAQGKAERAKASASCVSPHGNCTETPEPSCKRAPAHLNC